MSLKKKKKKGNLDLKKCTELKEDVEGTIRNFFIIIFDALVLR